MKILSTLFVTLLLLACNNQPPGEKTEDKTAQTVADDFTIVPGERIGLVTAEKSSRQDVLNAYGDNSRVDSVYLGEGQFAEGVVIYPDDPKRRVEFYWDEELGSDKPYVDLVDIEGHGSEWKTDSGITMGTSLEEVERINGKPFSLSGFGWDYGGTVYDWNGGKLEGLGLRFDVRGEQEIIPNELLGETAIESDNPKLRELKPVVWSIMVDFREPVEEEDMEGDQ